MAYTSSPQFDTYKSAGITFDGEDLFRTGDLSINRDLQIVNYYYDKISQTNQTSELFLVKRPGIGITNYTLSKSAGSDVVRGYYYDSDQNAFYWAINAAVYCIYPDSAPTARLVQTLPTSTGIVGFCSYLKSDDTRYVVFTDGQSMWLDNFATLSCVGVSSPDLPIPHQPYPVYLDGYVFVIKSGTGDIYNSDLDDPTSWTAGNFITAEMSSDAAVALTKAKNYLVALGQNSMEHFYDAGPATGSPLARNDSPFRSVGYLCGGKHIGDSFFFVGQDKNMNVQVFELLNFKIEAVSTSVVSRTLQTLNADPNNKSPLNFAVDGFGLSISGHNFYILTTPQTTWAYDVDLKIWYEWKGSDGTGLKLEASWMMNGGSQYLALAGQISISVMSPLLYQDFTNNYTCRYITEEFSQQTYNWKTLHRLFVIGDQWLATGTSNIMISWSDDNGTSWSAARPVNIFSKSPFITRLGRFRKRMFKLDYADNFPLRLRALELELNVGSN